MFFASNKLQRKRGERITDYITRFEEGVKTHQVNEINLLTTDDVLGWTLMRKSELDTGAARTLDCCVAR